VPTDRNLARMIQAGVVQKLDQSKLPNLATSGTSSPSGSPPTIPDNAHATNYMWGTTGIGYNVDKIKERMPDAPLDSWDMIFKPEVVAKFADCGVHGAGFADDMLPAALNYLGLNPDSKGPG
jgi:putrescine transport system substrate-binding protein